MRFRVPVQGHVRPDQFLAFCGQTAIGHIGLNPVGRWRRLIAQFLPQAGFGLVTLAGDVQQLGAAIQTGVVHVRVAGTQRFQRMAGPTASIQNMSGLQAYQSQPGQHPLRDFTIKKLSVIQGSAAIELLLDVGGVDWQRR